MYSERIEQLSVYAVIVSYHPDLSKLETLFQAISTQVQGVVVIDNGSSEQVVSWLQNRDFLIPYLFIPLGANMGIASAQNEGIRAARSASADYVILFDQDSCPSPDMVDNLLEAAHAKTTDGFKVAALGPRYMDVRQDNPPPFIKVIGMKVLRQPCSEPDSIVEVDYLIASGCLIPMSTLEDVGMMCDELFIDYVDIEWGLRAKSMGYQSFGVCGARMKHDLGDEPIEFLGKQYPHHSPLRHYYHVRNAVWMYRQPWLPTHWKLADGWRLLLKYGFYSILAKPRFKHWWMMTKGVGHGLIGRTGRLN